VITWRGSLDQDKDLDQIGIRMAGYRWPLCHGYFEATSKYESWLAGQIPLIPEDLGRKHSAMAKDVFSFLRATFYRWMQLWAGGLPSCEPRAQSARASAICILRILAPGVTSRAVWCGGVKDFDESSICRTRSI